MRNKRLVAEILLDGNVIMTVDNTLIRAEFGALDRGSLTDVVNWGIYANRGSLSFIDTVGYFNNSNVNSSEIKNAKVKFYLAKTTKELIATFNVAEVDFNDETKQVDIELQSLLLGLQSNTISNNIFFNSPRFIERIGISIEPNILNNNINFFNNAEIYATYIQGGTKRWNALNRLCQAGAFRISETIDGKPIMLTDTGNETPVVVDINNVINYSNNEFVKITSLSIDETDRISHQHVINENSIKTFNLYGEDGNRLSESDAFVSLETTETTGINNIQVALKVSFPYKVYNIDNTSFVVEGKIYNKRYDSNNDEYYVITYDRDMRFDNGYDEDRNQIPPTISLSDDHQTAYIFATLYRVKVNQTNYSINNWVLSFTVSFKHDYIEDTGTVVQREGNEEPLTVLSSNDLVQSRNAITVDDGYNYYRELLSRYILENTFKKLSGGIECIECECLFNNYYDENQKLVLDGSKLEHFEKYDIVIPYTVRQNQRVPFRKNTDGTPKQFRIIGIQYSYDGLLKQKLWLQEKRKTD